MKSLISLNFERRQDHVENSRLPLDLKMIVVELYLDQDNPRDG